MFGRVLARQAASSCSSSSSSSLLAAAGCKQSALGCIGPATGSVVVALSSVGHSRRRTFASRPDPPAVSPSTPPPSRQPPTATAQPATTPTQPGPQSQQPQPPPPPPPPPKQPIESNTAVSPSAPPRSRRRWSRLLFALFALLGVPALLIAPVVLVDSNRQRKDEPEYVTRIREFLARQGVLPETAKKKEDELNRLTLTIPSLPAAVPAPVLPLENETPSAADKVIGDTGASKNVAQGLDVVAKVAVPVVAAVQQESPKTTAETSTTHPSTTPPAPVPVKEQLVVLAADEQPLVLSVPEPVPAPAPAPAASTEAAKSPDSASERESPVMQEFHEILREQAAQLAALRDQLAAAEANSQARSVDEVELQAKAMREVLELRDRIYRAELAEKLAQAKIDAEQKLAEREKELQSDYEALQQKEQEAFVRQVHEQYQVSYVKEVSAMHASVAEDHQKEIQLLHEKSVAALDVDKAQSAQRHADRLKAIEQLRQEVVALEASLELNKAWLKQSATLHDMSAALFELSGTLASPTRASFAQELERLEKLSRALGQSDPVVAGVADVLRPLAATGVIPYHELAQRYRLVASNGRQAALVPEDGGIMGNLVAAVASKFIIPAKGPVVGDTPEAVFAKAEYHLEHGELNEAVAQLSRLRGMPASIVRDWLEAASDRVVVENAVKALHAHLVDLSHRQPVQINPTSSVLLNATLTPETSSANSN